MEVTYKLITGKTWKPRVTYPPLVSNPCEAEAPAAGLQSHKFPNSTTVPRREITYPLHGHWISSIQPRERGAQNSSMSPRASREAGDPVWHVSHPHRQTEASYCGKPTSHVGELTTCHLFLNKANVLLLRDQEHGTRARIKWNCPGEQRACLRFRILFYFRGILLCLCRQRGGENCSYSQNTSRF